MHRSLRPAFAAVLCTAFIAQSTGAADFAPLVARGLLMPPPGRMAPMPKPGSLQPAPPKKILKPTGEPWLVSATTVARWVVERSWPAPAVPIEAAPEPTALASFSAAARNELASLSSLPAPVPPPDRMLIAMEGRRVLASGLSAQLTSIRQYRSELKPLRARFIGTWVGRGAVRARVDYLNPFGITKGEAKGIRVKLSNGYERLLPFRGLIPGSLMKEVPLYFAGDSVIVEVRVRNNGVTPLTDLIVASVQEEHTASGDAGAPLSSPVIKNVATLAPGATAVLRWRIKLADGGREAVNFEQTHLRVLSTDPYGSEKVLLDQAQAGIVDPPGQ